MKRVSSTSSELNDFTETSDGKKEYNVSRSRLMSLINWVHVLGIYLPVVWILAIGVVVFRLVPIIYDNRFMLQQFVLNQAPAIELSREGIIGVGTNLMIAVFIIILYKSRQQPTVYLIDFSTFEPPESWRLSAEQILEIMRLQNCFTEDSLAFLGRMLSQSGCGPKTAWPPGILRCLEGLPADQSAEAARKESEIVIFDCVRNLLKKTKTKPSSVDFLIINCSLFSPTPSLCSMVINEFGMKADISSYNLSGMGCSAGLISVELAKNLLSGRPNSLALIVSTENLTQNLYHGNDRGFLLQNTLFRVGGAAILLSNKWRDGHRAAFKLLHVVRTQYVNEDSYGCVYETQDAENLRGVRLSKDIVKVAGRAMEKNFTALGPYVLPISEQLKVVYSMALRFICKQALSFGMNFGKVNPYIPNFKSGIEHFCIHAGGRGVIDGIEKAMQLSPAHVAASRHALYTYGNTSSSSIWYEMDYIRNQANLRRGERVLQVGFGSGFKCNSAVWLCLRNKKNKTELEDSNKKSQ